MTNLIVQPPIRRGVSIGPGFALCRRNKSPSRSDEPASDIDIAAVDSRNALGPQRPIREADIAIARDEGGGGEVYIFRHLEDGASASRSSHKRQPKTVGSSS